MGNKLELRPFDNTSGKAMLTKNVASFKESIKHRSMPTLPSAEYLFERPSPSVEFKKTRGMSSTGTLRIPPPPAPEEPPPPPRFELPTGDLYRHQYMGIARTPYGGYWRTMSMIGFPRPRAALFLYMYMYLWVSVRGCEYLCACAC